ncbi:hypothetical protein GYB22_05545 [bacterium]|nr:hypothetical protein [bacterium]
MNSFEITNHFGEYDRAVLDGDQAYEEYFTYLKRALNCLLSSFSVRESDLPLEIEVLKDYCGRFLNTIEAFRMKYAFSDNQSMLIDVTDSSFPNFLEFKRLTDDIFKKHEELKKNPSVESLKKHVLDHLIKNHEDPRTLLKQLSKVHYFDSLNLSKLFMEFTPGKLELISKLNDEYDSRRYFYSWASFDSVTNRPYIYLAVFDNPQIVDDKNVDIKREPNFIDAIKKLTHNTAPLNVIASDLDNAYEAVHPKIIKRIDIGPLFGIYSKDESTFTQMLKQHFTPDDFIITYTTEVIFSVGEKRKRSFLSQGELRQVFYIDESNRESMKRMVSQVDKYLITSHRVVQFLNENHPEVIRELAAPPYIYLS